LKKLQQGFLQKFSVGGGKETQKGIKEVFDFSPVKHATKEAGRTGQQPAIGVEFRT